MCIGDFIRMLHFRNEKIHELSENEKRAFEQPFSHFVIFQFFCILSRKTPYYHGNIFLSYDAALSSSIQTILLVLESHQILTWISAKSCVFTLADYTANREFHPALKMPVLSCQNLTILFHKKPVLPPGCVFVSGAPDQPLPRLNTPLQGY